jgi:tetratricopeptide (TPR) repeat protein
LCALLAACAALLIGCSSVQEKSARHIADAEHWAKEGRINEAILEYRRATQLNPKDPKAHLALAKIYIDRREYQSAYQQLQVVQKIDPNDQEARVLTASVMFKTRDFSRARKQAQDLLDLPNNQDDIEALMIVAQSSFAMKDLSAAASATDHVLRLDPKNGEAWYLKAALQLSDQKNSEGEASLLRAIEYQPEAVPPITALSALMARRGDLAGAEKTIREALVRNPQNIQIHYLLAAFLMAQNRGKEAEEEFRQIKRLGDSDSTNRGVLARYYLMAGNTSAAEKEYEDILKRYPDDTQNSLQLAAVYLEENKIAQAEQLVNAAIKKSPNDPRTLLFRGRLRAENGDLDAGISDMASAAQLKPDWALPQYFLGLAYIKKEKFNLAENSLNSATQLDPSLLAARIVLARLDIQQGRPDKAITAIEKTVEQKPNIIDPYLVRTLALVQEGRYDEAEKDALPLIDEFPQPPARAMTYRTLAEAKFHQNRFEEAHSFAKQSLAYDPTSQEGLYLLGTSQIAMKKNNEGIAEVEAYVKSNPKWAPGYETLAQLQALSGHTSDAEASLQKALDLDPTLVSAQLIWSEIELNQGKLDQAMNLLLKASQAQPQLADVQVRMGQISELKQDWTAAESYYSKALQLAPTNVVAKNNLAWVYAEHGGSIDLALKLAQEASEQEPDSPDVSDTLAWVLVKKQNYGTAIKLLQDCVQKEPKNAGFNYHLGVAYYHAGRKPEAEQALRAALKLEPGSNNADQAKELLATLK